MMHIGSGIHIVPRVRVHGQKVEPVSELLQVCDILGDRIHVPSLCRLNRTFRRRGSKCIYPGFQR